MGKKTAANSPPAPRNCRGAPIRKKKVLIELPVSSLPARWGQMNLLESHRDAGKGREQKENNTCRNDVLKSKVFVRPTGRIGEEYSTKLFKEASEENNAF